MAGVQEQYDFHAVLDAVWEDLVDELELDSVLKELENEKVFRRSEFRDLQEKQSKTNDKIRALLQLVKDGDYTKYDKFKQCLVTSGQERLVETIEKAQRGEYQPVVSKPRTEEEKLFEVLKEDLIAIYRAKESTISVAPLVEQHEVELTKFYVRPPMMAHKKPNAFGQIQQSEEKSKQKMSEEKTEIRSYRELLLNGNEPYRRICVTADAGMGKTSFAKCLAITWCEAHTKNVVDDRLVEETSFIMCDDEKHVSGETEGKGNYKHASFHKPNSAAYLSLVNAFFDTDDCSGSKIDAVLSYKNDSSGSKSDDTLSDNDDSSCSKSDDTTSDKDDSSSSKTDDTLSDKDDSSGSKTDDVLSDNNDSSCSKSDDTLSDNDDSSDSKTDDTFSDKDDSSGSETDDILSDNDHLYSYRLSFDDDLDTLKNFEYLFLIKLREYQCSDRCMLDDMILDMMKSLMHKTYYSEEFLQKLLCNKRCMIVVDGLDEWTHPQSCRKEEVIPHTKPWPGCTVLTTTRPWKLSTAGLSKSNVDRQVEISPLDETTAGELEARAIEILNENRRQNDQMAATSETKTMTDFTSSVPKEILGHIRYIPFMLLQMICLWFGNSPIGKSLCEVFSNIIELTLTRWLVKTDSGHTECECEPSKEHENIKLKCMENNRHCQRYMPLLLKIGQLAFSTLFNVIREESLLFYKEQVLKYLSKEELKQCLDMGLLSQVKDPTSLTKVRLQLYFPHKTLQEYFCALFIATNWNNADTGTMSIKQTISNKCTSVSDVLEMSKVFVIVCGLNPEVYYDTSRHLATIVSTDQSVIDYRNGVGGNSLLLEDYQRMQISCFQESARNQHSGCKIVIEDVIILFFYKDELIQPFEKILPCSLKYLTLGSSRSERRPFRIPEHVEFPCLERLSVYDCELALFQSVLTSAAHTLKYLKLREVSLPDDNLNAISDCISGCMSLQELTLDLHYYLFGTEEKPEECEASINYLLRSIEAKTTLTYLSLHASFLSLRVNVGHQNYILDLSKHDKLQELYLDLPLTELHINTGQLVKCEVYQMYEFSAPAVSSLLAKLHGATVLETLTLVGIRNPPPRIDITALPLLTKFNLTGCHLRDCTVTLTLPLLTKFTLSSCDLSGSTVTLTLPLLPEFTLAVGYLRDCTVTLSPEMTSLKTIKLFETTMNILRNKHTLNIPCCRELFLSISKLPQPITVKLVWIRMTAGEWRELLFDILGKLPKSIHVEMQECRGPSEEEWRHIFDDMKASPAFCVTSTDYEDYKVDTWLFSWEIGAYMTFDTVVV